MHSKIVMKAPPGVGGQIQASHSLKNYQLDANGEVTVDAVDVPALMGAGFHVKPHTGGPDTPMPPITSPSLTSDTEGAQALDPAAREIHHRPPANAAERPKNSQDFGNAVPPHSVARDDGPMNVADAQHRKAEADIEATTREVSGSDPDKSSSTIFKTDPPTTESAA